MQSFIFHAPTKIIFAENAASGVADLIEELGGSQAILITDAVLLKMGVAKPILESFQASSLPEPVIFSDVPSDSDIPCVNKAAQFARNNGCDCVIALGGGSVLDTAKAVAICITFGGDILQYEGVNNLPGHLKPLLAIPTTAGTGSEVSLVAMIKDSVAEKKLLFGSHYIGPSAAILDPNLLLSLPPKLTAATGFDALTHAIESYTAAYTTSPLTDAMCLEAMRLLNEFLPVAVKDGSNIEGRSATLTASTMAGLAFTNTGVGVIHALAHTIGGRFNTHHGMTNGVFLPYGMEFNLPAAKDKYAKIARYLGDCTGSDDDRCAAKLIEKLRALLLECHLPTTLRELGVKELSDAEIFELAEIASTDPAIMFNAREVTVDDLIELIKRAY